MTRSALVPWTLALATSLLIYSANTLSGQDTPIASSSAGTETFTLRGEVRDFSNEEPIPGAVVQIAGLGISQVTDANGYFEFPGFAPGEHMVVTASFGYETNRESSALALHSIILVRLKPMAIRLEGITVSVDALVTQLDTRRLMTGASASQTWDKTTMATAPMPDLTTFLNNRTADFGLFHDSFDQLCVRSRANLRARKVTVYVDEAKVPSNFLDNLGPRDIAIMEVYKSLGQVRVYTQSFLDRASDAGYVPRPIDGNEIVIACS